MSGNTKLILRPKVRFSQFSDKKRNDELIKEFCKADTNLQTNGPKIKSIITFKRPIRIVDSVGSASVHDKDISIKNCDIKIATCSDITSRNTQDTSLSNNNVSETKISRILCNANSSQDKKENDYLLQQDKKIYMQPDTLKYCRKILQQKDKENKDIVSTKITSKKNSVTIRTKHSHYKQPVVCKKLKLSTSSNDIQEIDNTNSKKTEMIKSRSAPNIIEKTKNHTTKTRILNTKSTLPNVMPCYRYIKTGIMKNKVSSVKKIVLHSTTNSTIKTSVDSGICHKQQNDIMTNKKCYTMSNAVEKLAQPEYNSVMCTFNKLKKIKQQKIVKDINHLPSIQKDLLNEKISTALDFPLDETIFKNLVDLSIDDKQMSTIMRTKDPEPRQKDIIPKLSDFFVPEYTKDICTSMHVKLRAPKINEDWNIFKISNKTLDWRHSLDDVR
ncbi:uncharacterized protein LOC116853692 [Odontomachus brunneus]|uniref:uncharacterized protein LOC116853692 n=1 Tax=Odontomachus brunneus TaxID=486640 RepID=UPI0013F1D6C3|nr:uncharacterized protein LOC116853692 [Odontomachus brunneus]